MSIHRLIEAADISGVWIKDSIPTAVRKADYLIVGALSGGIELASGPIVSVVVKALAANSGDVFLGASGTVYSGHGFQLRPGDALTADIDNLNRIYGMASVSGDTLTYLGIDY